MLGFFTTTTTSSSSSSSALPGVSAALLRSRQVARRERALRRLCFIALALLWGFFSLLGDLLFWFFAPPMMAGAALVLWPLGLCFLCILLGFIGLQVLEVVTTTKALYQQQRSSESVPSPSPLPSVLSSPYQVTIGQRSGEGTNEQEQQQSWITVIPLLQEGDN